MLGRAAATRLLTDGACLTLADIDAAALERVRAHFDRTTTRVRAYPIDVRDATSVQQGVDAAAADFGQIDILVNSAGVSCQGTVLDNPLAAWDRVIAINLTGSYLCSQAVARPW